jgi:putative endonuclease
LRAEGVSPKRGNLKKVTMGKQAYVYIMTNQHREVLYTGVTSDLKKRVYQHREGLLGGFTRRYNAKRLIYYEAFDDILDAIAREKQIKAGSRQKKIDLINYVNPDWRDLWETI